MFRKSLKIKASTIIETIVAMILILFIAGLISILVNNSARQNKVRTLIAVSRIKNIHVETVEHNLYENDFYEFDDMYIEKIITPYNKQKELSHIIYDAYDLQKNEILHVEKLIFNP